MVEFRGMKNAIQQAFGNQVYGIAHFKGKNKLSFVSETLTLEEIQKYFPQAIEIEKYMFHITWD